MRKLSPCLFAVPVAISFAAGAVAQVRVVGPGSTPQGDMARGAGVYLQGLGWYELNDARAAAVNADTTKKLYDWNKQIATDYRREYNAAIDREMTRRRMNDAAKKQFLAEREVRLRTRPTAEDIQKGDALNALLVDLSDPTIQESSWRGAKVPLPEDISIKSLAFQFAPKPGAKENDALTRGLIALGRLDTAGRWPDLFPLPKLKAEIPAYEDSYRKVRDQSLAGRLDLEAVAELDRSLAALEASVGKVVPAERGYRTTALQYIRDLKLATRMFDATTIGFAREMIADTNRHEAHTVGELLAFMRKYRLLFARADASPGGDAMYSRLYGLLSEQKQALGIKDEPAPESRPAAPADGEVIIKIVTARAYVAELNFRGNVERAPHKVAALEALKRAEAAVKARRSAKDDLAVVKQHLQALAEVGVARDNIQRLQSASQIIDGLLTTAR